MWLVRNLSFLIYLWYSTTHTLWYKHFSRLTCFLFQLAAFAFGLGVVSTMTALAASGSFRIPTASSRRFPCNKITHQRQPNQWVPTSKVVLRINQVANDFALWFFKYQTIWTTTTCPIQRNRQLGVDSHDCQLEAQSKGALRVVVEWKAYTTSTHLRVGTTKFDTMTLSDTKRTTIQNHWHTGTINFDPVGTGSTHQEQISRGIFDQVTY